MTDVSLYASYPEVFPEDLALAVPYAARQLVATIQSMVSPAGDIPDRTQAVRRFNRDMRALLESFFGFKEIIADFYPATGVAVGDKYAGSYSEIALNIGTQVWLGMAMFSSERWRHVLTAITTNKVPPQPLSDQPEAWQELKAVADGMKRGIYVPQDPGVIAPRWRLRESWFASGRIEKAVLSQLGTAIENELRIVARAARINQDEPSEESCWHLAEDAPPVEFAFGPLQGSEKEVAIWIFSNAKTTKPLRTALSNGTFWGRREGRYSVSVFFTTRERFSQANTQRLRSQAR